MNGLAQQSLGEKIDFLFFWGHTPGNNEEIGKFVLSQWYPCSFAVEGITFKNAEQWMMSSKARLFNDQKIFDEIIKSETPKEAKALGRQVSGFDTDLWDAACFQIVVSGNQHKFSQNLHLRSYLLSTADKVLVEASPVDIIWGNGLPESHPNAKDAGRWRGKNLLGFALMQVRDLLKQADQ